MKRPARLEDAIRAAEGLRRRAPGAETVAAIGSALAHPHGLVVAGAARAAQELRCDTAADALRAALDRLYRDPVKHDPQCRGKLAALAALDELGLADPAACLRAARHVQPEPVWGGTVDSAPPLRIRAAQALVRLGHHELYRVLGDLLVDAVGEVRGAAAQLLGAVGGERAALLLRLRLAVGDPDPGVLGDVAAALLACDGEASLPLAAGMLAAADAAVVEAAALALGGSRLPAALAPLLARIPLARDHRLRRALVEAVALMRSDAAVAALLELLRDGADDAAEAAARALRLYRDRPAVADQAVALIAARRQAALRAAWEEG